MKTKYDYILHFLQEILEVFLAQIWLKQVQGSRETYRPATSYIDFESLILSFACIYMHVVLYRPINVLFLFYLFFSCAVIEPLCVIYPYRYYVQFVLRYHGNLNFSCLFDIFVAKQDSLHSSYTWKWMSLGGEIFHRDDTFQGNRHSLYYTCSRDMRWLQLDAIHSLSLADWLPICRN